MACPLEAVFVAIISIHAPPRGATRQKHAGRHAAPISIHAPPRGATPKLPPSPPPMRFQFTPLREGRHEIIYGMRQNVFISIHAPPRGATRAPARQAACTLFQFTPLREGRPFPPARRTSLINFNSRPSARGDGHRERLAARDTHFNSRPSARGDGVSASTMARTAKFQFTPLREGRPGRVRRYDCGITFQFTPLREGRRNWNSYERLCTNFNSRPSARGDNRLGKRGFFRAYFNSRPSARGDGNLQNTQVDNSKFQFTPLREGRPGQAEEQLQRWMISIHAPPRGATHKVILRGQNIVFISIHAPPRGATPYARCIRASRDISIHAPPRGATATAASTETPSRFQFTPLREGRRASGETSNGAENFNSRPSARGDDGNSYRRASYGISIHAPPRGATVVDALPVLTVYFNSRPSARGDGMATATGERRMAFQFTPLREGRPEAVGGAIANQNISIHAPPRGATIKVLRVWYRLSISIHAPPRGATPLTLLPSVDMVFQFTPLREGRQCKMSENLKRKLFQFTPLREGRLRRLAISSNVSLFQFTPLREGRPRRTGMNIWARYFNSRPSARGDRNCRWRFEQHRISIHAPPRGATSTLWRGRFPTAHFNSRPSARGDLFSPFSRNQFSYFNSRPSARGDQNRFIQKAIFKHFNSRPSARGDRFCETRNEAKRRFQFTPLREGRRKLHLTDCVLDEISIHAPPRGATRLRRRTKRRRNFNSRPSARGDETADNNAAIAKSFQFTPLREGRRRLQPV